MFVKKIVFGAEMELARRKRLDLVTMIVNGVEMVTAKNLKVVTHVLKIADNAKLLLIAVTEYAMLENVLLGVRKIAHFLNARMVYVNLKKGKIA